MSLALKCHFLSLKGAFSQKMDPLPSSSSFSKENYKKSPLIWHLFLSTNDRGAIDFINKREKSILGLDCNEFIGKVTNRDLDYHEFIGKVTSRGLGYHESIGKVTSRGLGCYESIGKMTSRGLDSHESIGKVTGRGLGHHKTSLNTHN